MKAHIHYIGNQTVTVIENDFSFQKFIEQLFKAPVYLSLSKDTYSLAINTKNIAYVDEVKE